MFYPFHCGGLQKTPHPGVPRNAKGSGRAERRLLKMRFNALFIKE
jgi:hypothetical protein